LAPVAAVVDCADAALLLNELEAVEAAPVTVLVLALEHAVTAQMTATVVKTA
jgi:hypothetical protein